MGMGENAPGRLVAEVFAESMANAGVQVFTLASFKPGPDDICRSR